MPVVEEGHLGFFFQSQWCKEITNHFHSRLVIRKFTNQWKLKWNDHRLNFRGQKLNEMFLVLDWWIWWVCGLSMWAYIWVMGIMGMGCLSEFLGPKVIVGEKCFSWWVGFDRMRWGRCGVCPGCLGRGDRWSHQSWQLRSILHMLTAYGEQNRYWRMCDDFGPWNRVYDATSTNNCCNSWF